MFWRLLANENTKNLRRSILWVEATLLGLLMIAIFSVFYYVSIRGTPDGVNIANGDQVELLKMITWPGSLNSALIFFGEGNLGELLLIIFVGAVTAQEYTWSTYRLWLCRGTPRPLLLAAKFSALLVPTLLLVLTALISGAGVTTIFSLQINGNLNIDQLSIGQVGLSVLRTIYALLPYIALAFLLSIASRSATVAIGGGLAFAMLVETFLVQVLATFSGLLGFIAKVLPTMLTAGLVRGPQPGVLPPMPAAAGIALWTFSLVLLSIWVFLRQDFAG